MYDVNINEFRDIWPFNVACEVLDSDSSFDITSLTIDGICKAIDTLEKREKEIIYLRFKDKLTYQGISDKLGITRERCRQIVIKAINKLFYFNRRDMMLTVPMDKYRKLELLASQLQDKISDLESRVLNDEEVKEEILNNNAELKEKLLTTSIDYLDFSVRAWNCLNRYGCKTIGDITMLTVGDLFKLRNCGRLTINEIIVKLNEYGLSLKEEDNNGQIPWYNLKPKYRPEVI